VAEIFFCCGRPYCTDLYSPNNSTDLAQKSRQFWARFSRLFLDFYLFLCRMEQSIQLTVGTKIKVQYNPYSSTDLAWKSRQNLVALFWCREIFSLARNVYLLLFCTFLKLNNNISLSLIGFPQIEVFLGICLNL
jgi:hypothetical protein